MKPSAYLVMTSMLLLSTAYGNLPDSEFQTTSQDQKFADLMKTFDANNPVNTFEYKDSGTSLGMKIVTEGDKKLKWAPENEATNVEAQVVSYRIGRFLNMSDIIVPSAYYTVTGEALQKFKVMVSGENKNSNIRRKNKVKIQAAFAKSPNSMLGVVTPNVNKGEVKELVNSSANTINTGHALAKAIQGSGPMPSATKEMSFSKVVTKDGKIPTENELELARQLSKIMVLDMICGQYDRFSGGNLEASYDKNNKLKFLARDNGGAELPGTPHIRRYTNIVTRFDRAQIERLQKLSDALTADLEGTAQALEARTNTKSLRDRVKVILAHVKTQEQKYGNNAFFP